MRAEEDSGRVLDTYSVQANNTETTFSTAHCSNPDRKQDPHWACAWWKGRGGDLCLGDEIRADWNGMRDTAFFFERLCGEVNSQDGSPEI